MSSDEVMAPLPLQWSVPERLTDSRANECLERTDWAALCGIASRIYKGQDCRPLPAYTAGGSHLARVPEFQDGTRWIARIQMATANARTSDRLRSEVDTLAFLKARTKARVPLIFASSANDINSVGVSFLLLQFFPGNIALVESRKYQRSGYSPIPPPFRNKFYSEIAAVHVSYLSSLSRHIISNIRC